MKNFNPFNTDHGQIINDLIMNPEKSKYLDEVLTLSLIRYLIKEITKPKKKKVYSDNGMAFYIPEPEISEKKKEEQWQALRILFKRYDEIKNWNLPEYAFTDMNRLWEYFFNVEYHKEPINEFIEEYKSFLKPKEKTIYTQTKEDKEIIKAILRILEPEKTKLTIKPIGTANLEEIFDELKNYFNPEDHQRLWQFLIGEKIKGRICFNGNWIWLVNLYRRLLKNGFIHTDKTTLAKTLIDNFVYKPLNSKTSKRAKEQTTYDFLSQERYKTVPPENRIYNTIS